MAFITIIGLFGKGSTEGETYGGAEVIVAGVIGGVKLSNIGDVMLLI